MKVLEAAFSMALFVILLGSRIDAVEPISGPSELIVCGWDEVFILEFQTGRDHRKVWSWRANETKGLPEALWGVFKELRDWETENPKLKRAATFALPEEGGHDLQPLSGSPLLSLKTSHHCWLFDRDARTFVLHPALGNHRGVKSISTHPVTGQTVYVQAEAPNWWTQCLRFLDPAKVLCTPGEHHHKARWNLPGTKEQPGAQVGEAGYEERPHVTLRAVYGGVPQELFDRGETLADYAINAVFLGSGALAADRVSLLQAQGAKVFAEFNSMHFAEYLKDHPDAAPIGADGRPSPPPEGWQGVCPTHQGYRANRMGAFRRALQSFAIDGIWLDYHHAHASWERDRPMLPDTCFCRRCIDRFSQARRVALPALPPAELAELILTRHRSAWVEWRCEVFTDWVREYRAIIEEVRPTALLGTFHCPWSIEDHDGAVKGKLGIDLRAQSQYLDVLSPMPYHARFGHATDLNWISRQVSQLGRHVGVSGKPGERLRIWPIVQLSDWGEPVPADQVESVLDHGSRRPATGVIVFAWSGLRRQPEKVEALGRFYRAIRPR
jgi:hypothetical protein